VISVDGENLLRQVLLLQAPLDLNERDCFEIGGHLNNSEEPPHKRLLQSYIPELNEGPDLVELSLVFDCRKVPSYP
jgi:hypothetical protein